MLTIQNFTSLNGEVYGGFLLTNCEFVPDGDIIVVSPHYQIQFDRQKNRFNTRPAVLTIEVESDSKGLYRCKLVYADIDNIIWQDTLTTKAIRQKDILLGSISEMLETHINGI